MPENAARMEEARESACNDMGKMLQLVLPVATQIQQEVIKTYGFNNEGEGEHHAAFHNYRFTLQLCGPPTYTVRPSYILSHLSRLCFISGVLKFARLVKMYETQDPEIAAMSVKLKSLLLPPLSTPPIGGAIPAS